MENTYFTILKWWTAQRPQDRLFVFMVLLIATFGLTSLRLYGQKEAIAQSRYEDMMECEKRSAAQAEIKAERALKRSDSLRAADRLECENQFQNLLNERTPIIKDRTQKIQKELK